MKLTYEGHSCFTVEAEGLNLLIDPFISGNPSCKKKPEDFHPDLVLVTHGHYDHLGDAVEIARRCGATLVAPVELIRALDPQGVDTLAFNLGGCASVGNVHLIMVPAWHGSDVVTPEGPRYAGVACGYVIRADGVSIYHAGDTALFGDMASVLSRYNIDCALLPIGDFYTMGPRDAVTAAHWLKVKKTIPMHYNTFPVIEQDAAAFAHDLEDRTESRCTILQPGESCQL